MGVMGADNAWWLDVLENGPASHYATFFDIDWRAVDPELSGQGADAGAGRPVRERARARRAQGSSSTRIPAPSPSLTSSIAFRSIRATTRACSTPIAVGVAPGDDFGGRGQGQAAIVGGSRIAAVARRPGSAAACTSGSATRTCTSAGSRDLAGREPARCARDRSGHRDVQRGKRHESRGFDELHALLEAPVVSPRVLARRVRRDQLPALLRHQRTRRRCACKTKPCLRCHASLILDLAAGGAIDGLRIDHPDGLYDPERYFDAFSKRYRKRVSARRNDADGVGRGRSSSCWRRSRVVTSACPRPGPSTARPDIDSPTWSTASSSTARRRRRVDRACTAPSRRRRRLRRTRRSYRGKRVIMEAALASELAMLTWRALRIARADRRTRDFTFNDAARRPAEVVARFPGVPHLRRRTRRFAAGPPLHRVGRRARALAQPQQRRAGLRFPARRAAGPGAERAILTSAQPIASSPCERSSSPSPVTAKGVEDTAFYRYNRLVSLNEVGGDPEQFGTSVHAFHRSTAMRAGHVAAYDARKLHPRQQARRGCAGPNRRDLRDSRRMAPLRGAVEPAEPQPRTRDRGGARALAQRRIPALPDAGRHLPVGGDATSLRFRLTASASSATC